MTHPDFVIYCQTLDGMGGGREVGPERVSVAGSADEPLWIHVEYGHPGVADWLQSIGLPGLVADMLTAAETRPRAIAMQGGTLVMLRGVNMNPGADPEDMVSIRLWIEANRIITCRQRRLMAVTDIAKNVADGDGPKSIQDFVIVLIEKLADRIGVVVDNIEGEVEQGETDIDTDSVADMRMRLSAVRRQSAAIRRYLSPQRDALEALYRLSRELLTDDRAHLLREQADRITRYVEDLDLVRERAAVMQEELLNRMAQEQNARMYLLSIVAVIFLPLSFLTGVFGMNVAGLPGLENGEAFLYVAGGMLGVAIVMLAFLRWKRWL